MSKIEDAVASKLKTRALAGFNKYGVTMERTDLSRLDWLIHAQEEAMDLAVYLERLIQDERPKRIRLNKQSIKIGQLVEVVESVGSLKSGVLAKVIQEYPEGRWIIQDSLGQSFWMNPENLYHVQPKV